MPDPGRLYVVVEKHRRDLLRQERVAASAMVREYGAAWQRVRAQLDNLTRQIDEARRAGEEIKPSWLFEQNRLQSLLTQVEQEIARFVDYAEPAIREQQYQAVEAAQRHAAEAVSAVGDAPVIFTSFSRLHLAAVSDLIGFTESGPLRELLDELGPRVSRGFREAMIESLVVGRNPRETARRVRKEFAVGLSRALRISRTETLRSYREATRRNYESHSDIIEGWIWLAAKQERTCPMCLAMDGSFHKLSERLNDHPNGRCAMVPVLKGVTMPQLETGAEWLDKQDEATQRQVMGNAGYEAYKAGAVKLSDFVGQRRSKDWGTTRYARSLSAILGKDEAAKWREIAISSLSSFRASDYPKLSGENPLPFKLGSRSGDFEKDLRELERENRFARNEAIYVFDSNGEPVLVKTGGAARITVVSVDVPQGARVITHNHPSPGSFSDNDIQFVLKHRPQEFRVHDEKYLYRLWLDPDLTWDIVEPIMQKHRQRVGSFFEQMMNSGSLTEDQAETGYSHRLWQFVSKVLVRKGYYFDYRMEEWE